MSSRDQKSGRVSVVQRWNQNRTAPFVIVAQFGQPGVRMGPGFHSSRFTVFIRNSLASLGEKFLARCLGPNFGFLNQVFFERFYF